MESIQNQETRAKTEVIMKSSQIIKNWQAIPIQAQIKRPQTELEFEQLLELLDDITETLAARSENVEGSSLQGLFDLASAYALEWETANEEPIDATPREVLRQLLEENGLSLKQLEREGIAKQPLLSAILSGQREISKALAIKLANRFHTNVDLFIA
jgi:HTH-type transcriptional regulator / antitoxin HigA